jgi:intracellular septation protein
MGMELELSDAGWRLLTWRWVGFFLALAVTNEVVWRSFDRDTWVTFKVFGILPLTFVFAIAQVGLVRRHALEPAPSEAEEP